MSCYAERQVNVNAMLQRSLEFSAERLAVVDGDVRMSYRELDAKSTTLATNLAARGVKQGDRVAVMLANQLEAVLSVLAIARLGAILVPIGA